VRTDAGGTFLGDVQKTVLKNTILYDHPRIPGMDFFYFKKRSYVPKSRNPLLQALKEKKVILVTKLKK